MSAFTGFCPFCNRQVDFQKQDDSFRSLTCLVCKSLPRHRALFVVLEQFAPNWRQSRIHEGSPGWDILSRKLHSECTSYTASHFDPNYSAGELIENTPLPCKRYFMQDLGRQTFSSEAFDIVVTQDVFEHLPDPYVAISEISRTLTAGGIYIMSVPVVRKGRPSRRRARLVDGKFVHLMEPQYHRSPVSTGDGSLVTVDWGYDIAAHLHRACGMNFVTIEIDDMSRGIRDECNQTIVGLKTELQPI